MDFEFYREKLNDEPGIEPGKPKTWSAIKSKLIAYRRDWLEEAGKDVKNLSELAVAIGINKFLHVITLENGKVAIYDPDQGYYIKDYKFAYKLIHILQPTFNETKCRNVLFMLASMDRKYGSTDFEPEYHDVRRYILVKNGIYDKYKRKLLPFDHRFINFSTIETELIPNAPLPTIDGWDVESWLLDLMSGDKDLVKLLWQVVAASLNGNYSYRKSIWFVGNGNDGKGTFQQMISNLVGFKNVAPLKLNQFSERFGLAIIEGKTVIIGDDVQAGIYVDESSNFNSVVTGEPVSIEKKGENPYMAIFKKTVIQSTNGMPSFKNKSNGTYRRIIIIPFKKTFSSKEDNWAIKDDYINRKEVLEYVLWKAINLDFDRFSEPKATQERMTEFKEENNSVLRFLNEYLPCVESTRIPVKFLWILYQAWCKADNVTLPKKSNFDKELDSCLSEDWVKDRQKPLDFFKPAIDKPDYFIDGTFNWKEEDKKKTAVLIRKVTQ
ncbi:DNA primase [Streptococcus dysgalactiae subsp. equisimilis]|uniref:phage/plasmid primase, P4 family n=2 Tax=Streptococcus dysgalactiae TaxID=1334 RepID=UPI0010CF49E2|nr:phage/plasmid primase, P4 family [Streptococcus dysgalactiae]VTT19291.1 DNA primase [Streptococcus dysgalactiae subsp. equisimilis]